MAKKTPTAGVAIDATNDPELLAAVAADDPLAKFLLAAARAPASDEAWEKVSELAAELQRPDEVAAMFRKLLAGSVSTELANSLGERAARFHDEWFEDPAPLAAVLTRVLDVDPAAEWAFHRLTLLYTRTERWTDLLALYDRALASTTEKSRRVQLLDEAAHVAKDFAGQADRAIQYLEQLFPLKPQDAQLATSLERLFERQGRHSDLIKLWTARVAVLPKEQAQATRARIAACWLEPLDNPGEALTVIEQLLAEAGGDTAALPLLERIVALGTADASVRRRALVALKARYDAAHRADDIVRVLRLGLDFASPDERIALHREIAERLIAQGHDAAAVDHAAALLVLQPASSDARHRLHALVERTGAHARYADALVQAADAAGDDALATRLLVEAANVRCDVLADEPAAIALFARVLATRGADAELLLGSARRACELLERAARTAEQLDVLERLSVLEPEADARRTALGRAAHLADSLGEPDRALASWQKRLAADARDGEALDAMVDLLARAQRWEPLIEVLRSRAAVAAPDDARRREDLVRIARTYAGELRSIESAIKAWSEVEKAFGANEETVDALADLLAQGERWAELATVLTRAAEDEPAAGRRAQLLHRLGDVYSARLAEPARAAECYGRALAADPRNEGARAGMRALLSDASCARAAVAALATAYATTDEWALSLEILEHRLAAADDDAERTLILLEAATIQEQRAADAAAALVSVRRALPYAPGEASIERELLRLAEATGQWAVAVEGYRDAIAAKDTSPARMTELQFQQGTLLETRLADLPAALEVFARVVAAHPDHAEATAAVVRVAARTGAWPVVAGTLVGAARAWERVEAPLFASAGAIAAETAAWDAASAALGAALAAERGLKPAVAREIQTRLALWHRDERGDKDAAEAALLRAVEHDGSDAETLRMLAALQRRAPGRPLVTTLLHLADATHDDAEALHEAADVSMETLNDRVLAEPILTRLLKVSSDRWQASTLEGETSGRSPEFHAAWVLEHLVKIHLDAGTFEQAVKLLADGATLPFDPDTSRSMRRRAAEIATEKLADGPRAIELYRGILAETPQDERAIARLAALYEAHARMPDLLELRRHELSFAPGAARRLELRLDVARVLGVLGDRAGRIAALRENLEEHAGHAASVAELTQILEASENHGELADVLAEQATRLQSEGNGAHAASLWARVALIAEARLGDVDRALASLGKVVELDATLEALDALARLHTARGEHAAAVGWLEQRLARSPADERAATVVRLAQAHTGAGQDDRAVAVLEQALSDDPGAANVRTLLAELYRARGAWEPLARLLTEGRQYVTEVPLQLAYLREAAEIYHRRLQTPDESIPILELAAHLAPTDRSVRTALADALRAAGRLDEARTLLEGLVEEFGRRRPPERAAVHFQLAQIAKSRGDVNDALAQLDLAAAMDVNHAGILRMLGDLARDTSQFERAERAYRALLLIVRRHTPATVAEGAVGASEVQFELYQIATQLDQAERAREILESAFETASQNDAEARRFERTLRAGGHTELLLRSLDTRLARTQEPTAQAEILGELASVQADLGRTEEALATRIRALSFSPGAAALHDSARELAERAGAVPRYAECLAQLAEKARAEHQTALASELLLRLGALTETALADLPAARDIFQAAEATGENVLPACRALDRICAALGDAAGQVRALHALTNAPDVESAERTDALYRLAEIELRSRDTRSQGAETLSWALDQDPQYDRAAAMLRVAPDDQADDPRATALFERVARAVGDPAVLLEALTRGAAQPDAGADLLREAVDLAMKLELPARAEELLTRAIELARDSAGGLAEGVWALVALAERRKEAGDLVGAIKWMREASDVAEPAEALQLGLEVATLAAGHVGDLPLAAEVYEKLRQRDPTDRAVWEPLLDVYRSMGEREKLEKLIADTLDAVFDAGERNRLRMERARILLGDKGREEEAVGALKDILDEDPGEHDAAALLQGLLERTGRDDELSELLARQLDTARDRQEATYVVSISLRLGALYQKNRREDALGVYRAALEWAPENRDLLVALLGTFTPEDDQGDRADAMERLLALESGARAGTLARELIAIREAASDEAGVERALDRGFRSAPEDAELRDRLERWYTERTEWEALANMLVFDANARKEPSAAVELLRRAATLHREQLSNPAAALEVLKRARETAPADPALLAEYVRCLAAAGEHGRAIEELTGALEPVAAGAPRAELLKLRAEVYLQQEEGARAVADLEEAVTQGGDAYRTELVAGLTRHRELTMDKGEWDAARLATLRLVELLGQLGEGARSRELLADWVEREPNDRAALKMLAEMNAAAEQWSDVAAAYTRLIELETGDDQLAAVLHLADACEKLGKPEDARDGLEAVFKTHPGAEPLRAHLRKLYEHAGAHQELATLYLSDAEHAADDATRFDRLRRAGELLITGVGDPNAAVEPLERALKLRPGDHDAVALLSDAYLGAGKVQEATNMLEAAIAAHKNRRSPQLAQLQHRMARCAAAAGDRNIELAWLNVALDSDMQNGTVASELADVAFEFGQTEVALKALRAVTLMKSPGPMTRAMAFLRQGMIAQQQGDARKAIFLAKKALAEDPALSDASNFLRDLGE